MSRCPPPVPVEVLEPVIVPVVRPGIGKSDVVGFGTAKVVCFADSVGLDLEVEVDTDVLEERVAER